MLGVRRAGVTEALQSLKRQKLTHEDLDEFEQQAALISPSFPT